MKEQKYCLTLEKIYFSKYNEDLIKRDLVSLFRFSDKEASSLINTPGVFSPPLSLIDAVSLKQQLFLQGIVATLYLHDPDQRKIADIDLTMDIGLEGKEQVTGSINDNIQVSSVSLEHAQQVDKAVMINEHMPLKRPSRGRIYVSIFLGLCLVSSFVVKTIIKNNKTNDVDIVAIAMSEYEETKPSTENPYRELEIERNNQKNISSIFSYDMIGNDISYLESLIGTARKTDADSKLKTYIVDNCELQVGYDGLNITTLSVETGGKCNFILQDIVPFSENLQSNQLAFGLSGPVTYYSDCLTDCGNAYDPAIYELYTGSRAENWRELLISSVNVDYDAKSQWLDKMIVEEGEEWVMENRFNCNPEKYNDIAVKSMEGQRAERVMIGYGLEEKAQLRWGCDKPFDRAPIVEVATTLNQGVEKLMEIPFQEIYRSGDYYQYAGSQVISGQLSYSFNDMEDVYQYRLEVDQNDLSKLPNITKGFTFNSYEIEIDTRNAASYFGVKADLNSMEFRAKNCSIEGPVTLQIIKLSLDIPQDAGAYISMEPLKIIQSGPFRVICEEY